MKSLKLIEAQGFPAVVAVNSELDFERYLQRRRAAVLHDAAGLH